MNIEFARVLLGVFLISSNVAVWLGVWLENDKFTKETKDRGWRLLVYSLAAETALSALILAADTSLSMQQGDEIIKTQRAESAMLEDLKPRQFTEAEFNACVDGLRGHVKTLTVFVKPDSETSRFAVEFVIAFQNAGASVNMVTITDDLKVSIPIDGQTLLVPSASAEVDSDMRALVDAFVKCHVRGSTVQFGELPGVPLPSLFIMPHPVPLLWFPTFNGTPAGLPAPPWEIK